MPRPILNDLIVYFYYYYNIVDTLHNGPYRTLHNLHNVSVMVRNVICALLFLKGRNVEH